MKNAVEFKIWDGKKMITWKQIKAKASLRIWLVVCMVKKPKNVTVLQFVQSCDISKKKIFEGDIIEHQKTKSRYIVEDLIEFNMWASSNSIDTHLSHKIIGNIYETHTKGKR